MQVFFFDSQCLNAAFGSGVQATSSSSPPCIRPELVIMSVATSDSDDDEASMGTFYEFDHTSGKWIRCQSSDSESDGVGVYIRVDGKWIRKPEKKKRRKTGHPSSEEKQSLSEGQPSGSSSSPCPSSSGLVPQSESTASPSSLSIAQIEDDELSNTNQSPSNRGEEEISNHDPIGYSTCPLADPSDISDDESQTDQEANYWNAHWIEGDAGTNSSIVKAANLWKSVSVDLIMGLVISEGVPQTCVCRMCGKRIDVWTINDSRGGERKREKVLRCFDCGRGFYFCTGCGLRDHTWRNQTHKVEFWLPCSWRHQSGDPMQGRTMEDRSPSVHAGTGCWNVIIDIQAEYDHYEQNKAEAEAEIEEEDAGGTSPSHELSDPMVHGCGCPYLVESRTAVLYDPFGLRKQPSTVTYHSCTLHHARTLVALGYWPMTPIKPEVVVPLKVMVMLYRQRSPFVGCGSVLVVVYFEIFFQFFWFCRLFLLNMNFQRFLFCNFSPAKLPSVSGTSAQAAPLSTLSFGVCYCLPPQLANCLLPLYLVFSFWCCS